MQLIKRAKSSSQGHKLELKDDLNKTIDITVWDGYTLIVKDEKGNKLFEWTRNNISGPMMEDTLDKEPEKASTEVKTITQKDLVQCAWTCKESGIYEVSRGLGRFIIVHRHSEVFSKFEELHDLSDTNLVEVAVGDTITLVE